jgi:hypothetical protein
MHLLLTVTLLLMHLSVHANVNACCSGLQEAANNNIFSDPTNRVLNLGLGVASWAHVAVLLPLVGTAQAGPLALPLTAFWGVAGLTTSLIAAFPK